MGQLSSIDFYFSRFLTYGNSVLYIMVYVGSLVYISKKKDKVMKQIFLWPVLIALLSVYNPIIMEPLLELLNLRERYHRFFWILPITILGSYVLARIMQMQSDVWKKTFFYCFVVLVIMIGGAEKIELEPSENIYKLPDDVINVADIIQDEKIEENPIILCGGELFYTIRQYNPTFILTANQNLISSVQENGSMTPEMVAPYCEGETALALITTYQVDVDATVINTALEDAEVDFYVLNKGWYTDEYLQSLNGRLIGSTDNYEVYCCDCD